MFAVINLGAVLAFSFLAVMTAGVAPAASPDLTEEGEARRDAHRLLFGDFIAGRQATFRGDGDLEKLHEVVVSAGAREFRDGDVLELPEGSQRVASMFRHFAMEGANLSKIKDIRFLPFAADSSPHESKQVEDFFRVQFTTMPLPVAGLPTLRVKFDIEDGETIRVDRVLFTSGLATRRFDDIAYRNLGVEFPRERVRLDVDVSRELSVGGTANIRRERFLRYYAAPGGVHASYERWADERNFLPGRQIFKMEYALVRGYSESDPKLREVAGRPGVPDLSFFEAYDAGGYIRRIGEPFKDIEYAMCFDNYPEFMATGKVGRGTPRVEHFDDAAELAAGFIADQIRDGGRTATWWEVKNESSIKSEWDHHWKKDVDGWALLAEFHNKVADAVHAVAPDTKVGGPTSAWMQLQVGDFGLYRSQADFVTRTRESLDFYSHHFYENIGTLGAHERRGRGYENYLLGRYEACLDMLRAHMHAVDAVKPILITECGSLQPGRQPSDNWSRLQAWSAFVTKSLQRPDQLDLVVPFVFLTVPWNPTSGNAAFVPGEGAHPHAAIDEFESTPIAYFFELWRDFDGNRLPVAFDRDWLDVVVVHDETKVSIAATNMGGRRLELDLSRLARRVDATSVRQTRLRYVDGEMVFEPSHDVEAEAVPVDVGETTVVHVDLSAPLRPYRTLRQARWFAHATAVKSAGRPLAFEIEVDEPAVSSATLVVGVHREGGISRPLEATLNGRSLLIDVGDAGEFSEYFAPLELEIPASWVVQGQNRLELAPVPGMTVTSAQIRTLAR
ncbi:MAG: beta-agarase [Planctomycetota bacterium]